MTALLHAIGRAGIGPVAVWLRPSRRPLDARPARFAGGLLGLAVGVAMIVASGLGAAPWDVLNLGLADRLGAPLPVVMWSVGGTFLTTALVLGQRIRPGTVVTVVTCGPLVAATLALLPADPSPASAWALLLLGTGLLGVGAGAYLTAGCGVGPLDMVFEALRARRWPMRPVRLAFDGAALVAGWALGGTVGPGTLVLVVLAPLLIPGCVEWFEARTAPRPAVPEPAVAAA